MDKERVTKYIPEGTSISDWSESLKNVDSKLSHELEEDKREVFRQMQEMGLPTCRMIDLPLQDFLNNPQEYLDRLKTKNCYVMIFPGKQRQVVQRNADDVVRFIRSELKDSSIGSYDVMVVESPDSIYGGNITINKDGSIKAEFKEGLQGPIAAGSEIPQFSVTRINENSSFIYSFKDDQLKKQFNDVIYAIPHDEQAFLPGYYEFVLTPLKDEKDGPLTPVFIDYKDKGSYYTK